MQFVCEERERLFLEALARKEAQEVEEEERRRVEDEEEKAKQSQSCSRGTSCNFIHCFRNPGGDYEWADLDEALRRYWLTKMAALFGYADESVYDRQLERKKSERMLNSYKMLEADSDRSVSFWYLSCELNNVLNHNFILPSFIKEYVDLYVLVDFSAAQSFPQQQILGYQHLVGLSRHFSPKIK